ESAKYAAEHRNFWWSNVREAQSNNKIIVPKNIGPYPQKSDQISDEPAYDRGGNFGRFARTGIMDEYLQIASSQLLCGVRADHWRTFFKLFQDQKDESLIFDQILAMKGKITNLERISDDRRHAVLEIIELLETLI